MSIIPQFNSIESHHTMSIRIVQNFASFLDNIQFKEAGECLSADCRYEYEEGKYQNRNIITAIYKQNDLITRKLFDELRYSSEVEQIAENEFKINYTDSLRKGALWHENRFYDVVKVQNDLIVDIHHHSIPGAEASMREFYTRAAAIPSM